MKVWAKAEMIKEQAKKTKEYTTKIKENDPFRLVWMGLEGDKGE